MRRIVILFLVLLTVGACTSNTIYKKPDDLIPREEMINLLTDIYLADAAQSNPNISNVRNIHYLPLVYNKYKIDSNRFKSSNLYYMSKVKDYKVMFEAVVNKLKLMREAHKAAADRYDSIFREKEDSIRKLRTKVYKIFPKKKIVKPVKH